MGGQGKKMVIIDLGFVEMTVEWGLGLITQSWDVIYFVQENRQAYLTQGAFLKSTFGRIYRLEISFLELDIFSKGNLDLSFSNFQLDCYVQFLNLH